MAIKTFTSGEVLTASDTNTYLANAGLVYVTSKTWTTTANAQQIDNCFTSTFANYRIVVSTIGSQASPDNIYLRLVDGTTPIATTNYYNLLIFNSTAGTTRNWLPSNANLYVGYVGNNSGQSVIDIFNPQVAQYTSGNVSWMGNGTGDFYAGTTAIFRNDTTQYEGIYLHIGSGTWSGTATVYGYRQA